MKRKNELNDIYKEATQNAEFCKSVERSETRLKRWHLHTKMHPIKVSA